MPRVRSLLAGLVLMVLGALPGDADAAARLVMTVEGSVQVWIDGQHKDPSMGGGQIKLLLTPGVHIIQITDPEGNRVYSGQVDMPGDGERRVHWSAAHGLQVLGPDGEPVLTDEVAAVEMDPDEEENTALAEAQDDRTVSQTSGNESAYAGDPERFSAGAQKVGAVAADATGLSGYTSNPGLGSGQGTIRQQAVSSASSSVSGMVRNAEAGGSSAFGSSSSSSARQGNPTPPDAVTGFVSLVYTGTAPVTVYVDGWTAAQFDGADDAKVKLEIGFHDIEVRGAGHTLVHTGKLNIDEDFTVELKFGGPGQAPAATNRSWSWAAM